ncbi:MAG: ABC transporter permease [Bacillota bacterium]
MKFKRKYLGIPYVIFLLLFVVLPLLFILWYAFTDAQGNFTISNFTYFFTNSEALNALIYSLYIALATTGICLLIAYPVAMILSNKKYNKSSMMIVLFILPMWMNFLLRTLSIREMFFALDMNLGELTTIIGMVYNFLPFMILPIYTTLLKMDKSLIEAAEDLGAKPHQVFVKVTLPLSVPGIVSGILMVFMPTISTFVISDLLSVGRIQLLGNLINLYFTTGNNWHLGSAIALLMLVLIGITMLLSGDSEKSERGSLW